MGWMVIGNGEKRNIALLLKRFISGSGPIRMSVSKEVDDEESGIGIVRTIYEARAGTG